MERSLLSGCLWLVVAACSSDPRTPDTVAGGAQHDVSHGSDAGISMRDAVVATDGMIAVLSDGASEDAGDAEASVEGEYVVTSPDGSIRVTLVHDSADGSLALRVSERGVRVLDPSPLGIATAAVDFADRLAFVERTDTVLDQTYSLPAHKKASYRNHANEMSKRRIPFVSTSAGVTESRPGRSSRRARTMRASSTTRAATRSTWTTPRARTAVL